MPAVLLGNLLVANIRNASVVLLVLRAWFHDGGIVTENLRGSVYKIELGLSRWTLTTAPTQPVSSASLSTSCPQRSQAPTTAANCFLRTAPPPTPPRWTEIVSPVSWGCSCQVFCQWQERKKKRNTSINSFTRWKFCFSCLAYAFLIKPGNPTFLSSLRRNRTGSVGLNIVINASVPLTSFSGWGYFERKTLWVHKRLLGFQAQS